MKKYDKEYSTQYTPEMEYLRKQGIRYSFVKTIDDVTTYKYTKTPELFRLLGVFYERDNTGVIKQNEREIHAGRCEEDI